MLQRIRALLLPLLLVPTILSSARAQDAERLARLASIAAELQDARTDAPALLTEACRLCGFAIWNEDREPVAEPLGVPRLGLAVTTFEIEAYAQLFRAGDSVALDDLVAALDVLAEGLVESSVGPHVAAWRRDGTNTAHASARALATFLEALANQRAGGEMRLDASQGVVLDPIQALLMLRVLTEDLGVPLRRAIADAGRTPTDEPGKRDGEPESSGRGPHVAELAGSLVEEPAPGWAEDAYVGGITGLFGEVVGRLGETGKSVSGWIGKANAIATIAKFITTYTFLRCELGVDDPGQPLVRTKTTDPGEPRTLFARFTIDGTRVTDWMKANRRLVALAGLDIDMAKTGPLAGVETEWQIVQNRHSTRTHLVQTQRGKSNLTRVVTDPQGEARIHLEGKPQARNLDPLNVLAVEKAVRVWVTPQTKAVEMKQDLLDAVTGAIGIRGGPVGWLTPVFETLYRMKWSGTRGFDLKVRDWTPSETIGQAEITLRASGSTFERNRSYRVQLDRALKLTDIVVETFGVDVPPEPDPEMMKRVPPNVRRQIEEGMRQMREMAKRRTYVGKSAADVAMHVHDVESIFGPEDGCSQELFTVTTTWNGRRDGPWTEAEPWPGGAQFVVDVDFEAKTATLRLEATVLTTRVTTSSKKDAVREEAQEEMSIFRGLTLLPPYDRHLTFPLKETHREDRGVTDYYGTASVPFRFGRNRYQGTAIVSFSVTRKLPPAGEGR